MDEHPFRVAWRTRDLDRWIDALSSEVVLHSPVLKTPFRGRAEAIRLFGVLFAVFGEVEIVRELTDTASHAFLWRADLAGKRIEGVDFLSYDDDGKVAEIRVMIRPLADIAVFTSAIGPPLAAQQSPARGTLVRLLTRPLELMLTIADTVSSRLVQR